MIPADLAPLLGGGLATQLLGIVMGMALHRRFVMGAVADADRAHEHAIETHRKVADDAVATHRKLSEDLAAEFADYRERAAAERGRLEERLATIAQRLDECKGESHEMQARVTMLEAKLGALS